MSTNPGDHELVVPLYHITDAPGQDRLCVYPMWSQMHEHCKVR
jgi:hypothetical protein